MAEQLVNSKKGKKTRLGIRWKVLPFVLFSAAKKKKTN